MISTRGRYALRVMADLAGHDGDGYVPLRDIAARQGISKKYMESIVHDLSEGGLVTGISGKHGGYRLTRRPEDCTILEILTLTEGSLSAVACLQPGAAPCPRASECSTLSLWTEFDRLTHDFFAARHLSDIARSPSSLP